MLQFTFTPNTASLDNEVVINGNRFMVSDEVAKTIATALEKALKADTAVLQPKVEVKAAVASAVTSKKSTSTNSKKSSTNSSEFEKAGGRKKYEEIAEKLGVLYEDKDGTKKVAKKNRTYVYDVMYGRKTLTAVKKELTKA